MFQSHAHRIAGHAAAAASPNTPAHLRVHQQRLANMKQGTMKPQGISPKNMLMSQPPAETISGNAMRSQVMAMQQQKGMTPSGGAVPTAKKSKKRSPVFSSPIYG